MEESACKSPNMFPHFLFCVRAHEQTRMYGSLTLRLPSPASSFFGPFAGFSPMAFKLTGTPLDLLATLNFSNIVPTIAMAMQNLDLVKYLISEVFSSKEKQLEVGMRREKNLREKKRRKSRKSVRFRHPSSPHVKCPDSSSVRARCAGGGLDYGLGWTTRADRQARLGKVWTASVRNGGGGI